ncbi:MAG: hypothetical protein QF410_07550 [Planctomycetota bacterium]|nr:hypothetical protein [Planctomycetota bacterium]
MLLSKRDDEAWEEFKRRVIESVRRAGILDASKGEGDSAREGGRRGGDQDSRSTT